VLGVIGLRLRGATGHGLCRAAARLMAMSGEGW